MSNANIYTVYWGKLEAWLNPLCKNKLTAFITAVVTPVNDLHTRFITFRNYVIYQMGITPQVCYMQKALNDKYDIDLRRIVIVDGIVNLPQIFYQQIENKPETLYTEGEAIPMILYTKAETAMFTVDFVVKVPASIVFDRNEMTAFVNSYKLPSRTFDIITF